MPSPIHNPGLAACCRLAARVTDLPVRPLLQILEMRTEAPEVAGSLATLSEFYTQDNTPAARRRLRSAIENEGVKVNQQYLSSAESVIKVGGVDEWVDGRVGGVISCQTERCWEEWRSHRSWDRVLLLACPSTPAPTHCCHGQVLCRCWTWCKQTWTRFPPAASG